MIGIFGGSFDPIHLGHLSLIVEMREAHHLEEVWLCPTASNPHKAHKTFASPEHRLEMIRLVIGDVPWLKVIENEIFRTPPCYTNETLHELLSSYPSMKFALIVGDDTAHSFHRWHLPDEIIKCAQILIGRRHCDLLKTCYQGSPAVISALNQGLTPTRIIEISSTEIRERLAKRLYCGHLLPGKVLDYILAHDLYLGKL